MNLHNAEEQTKIDDEFISQCCLYITKTANYNELKRSGDVVNMMLNCFKTAFYTTFAFSRRENPKIKDLIEEIGRRLDSIKM